MFWTRKSKLKIPEEGLCLDNTHLSELSQAVLTKHINLSGQSYRKGFCTIRVKRKGSDEWLDHVLFKANIVPNSGRDEVHNRLYIVTAAEKRGAGFIALTVDATGTDVTDTTLPGEITTGGLARADATTKTHTGGTNTSTLQETFSATATHTNVQMSALLNAASVGDMLHEDTFTPVTLNNGDDLQVTWTLTAG